MTTLGRHLGQFYVVVVLMVYAGAHIAPHTKETSKNLKRIEHLQQKRLTLISKPNLTPHLGIEKTDSGVRKTSDQFKWPWKTYEEWKRNQEQIENRIDQMIKSRVVTNHNKGNRMRISNPKLKQFRSARKRKIKPGVARDSKRRKKNIQRKQKQKARTVTEMNLDENLSTGGAVIALKYYSTEDVNNAVNIQTAPARQIKVLGRPFPHQMMNSKQATKRKHGQNECSVNNGGCEGLCVQSKASYYCHCPDGFRLDASRRRCVDLNECLPRNGHGPCQGDCHNSWGSFKCGCDSIPGTHLDVDGVSCVVDDRCSDTDCSHICVNTRSGAFCSCPEGFILNNDWKTCREDLLQ